MTETGDTLSRRLWSGKPHIYFRDGKWRVDIGNTTGWAGGSPEDRAFRFIWDLNYAATAGDDIPW